MQCLEIFATAISKLEFISIILLTITQPHVQVMNKFLLKTHKNTDLGKQLPFVKTCL